MLRTHWLFLYRICAVAAVFVSALLFLHYLSPVDSGFCASGGGCEKVRSSVTQVQLGPYLNIPMLGILAYGALLIGSLFPARGRIFGFSVRAGIGGGVVALLLVITQALVIQAYCWLCLIVDGLAVATAFVAVKLYPLRFEQSQVLKTWAWVSGVILAFGLPLLWNAVKPEPAVPSEIRALYEPGKINVVEFADFQCPHCTRFHPILKGAFREHGDRINFVRKHMPLVQHQFADHAAKGAICAGAQGKENEMSDELFSRGLKQDVAFKHAEKLDLDMGAFRDCMKAKATRDRIEEDSLLLQKIGFEGLPTTYIGDQKFIGVRPVAVVKEALMRASGASAAAAVPTSVFVSLSLALLLGLAFLGRSREEPAGPDAAVKP